VDNFALEGFSTGMFISETIEAYACGLRGYTRKQVEEQNDFFCDLLSKVIDRSAKKIYDFINEEFGELAHYNQIADYNHKLLKLF
jgi:hypothetical protein